MANYSSLKTTINNAIKTNGANEITGALLQQVLNAMVNSIGAQYQFVGIATPSTNPGTPDYNVAYLAGPGSYPNFGNSVVPSNTIAILKYNGSWSVDTLQFSGGGSTVQVIPTMLAGTQVAVIRVDGTNYNIYAPSGGSGSLVEVFPLVTVGTKIATIRIDGNDFDIYAPSGGGGGGYPPDGEDIDLNANNALQFANRISGTGKKGYKILRTSDSFANQVSASDTIYEIRYNFDLNAETVTIPENCMLMFNGGRVTNGILTCSNGVEIHKGNFLNCPLHVRGDFRIYDSYIEINSNIFNTQKAGGIVAEYGTADVTSYVEIKNCRIIHRKNQAVYGDCIKLIADAHSIRYNISGNYLSGGYWACIESQSYRNVYPSQSPTFCSGTFENNTVLMSGSAGEGLGISLVAMDSETIIANNYVEAFGIGIEFADNALISGNTVLMASGAASRYAIQSSLQDDFGTPKMATIIGNKVLRGRVGITNGNVPVKIVGNEINGTLTMDGRVYHVRDFYIQDNTIIQDNDDKSLPALALYFNNDGTTGYVSGNYVYDRNSTDPIISFSGLHNCKIVNNKFVFAESKGRAFIINGPDNVEFSDNEIVYSALTQYANVYGLIDVWSGSVSGAKIMLYRNTYEIGNLAAIKQGVIQIKPYRDADDPFSNIFEDGTIIKDFNDRKVGTTGQRQDVSLYGGITSYFDLTLNKTIWWQSPNWWDAAGNAVV